jgi:hypothetical protein
MSGLKILRSGIDYFAKYTGIIADYVNTGLEKNVGCDENFDLGPNMDKEISYRIN